jgi:hypothetical protein
MRLQRAPGYGPLDGDPDSTGWRDVRPIVILNPRSDARFVGLVSELMAAAVGEPEGLQAGLRAEFPDAVVRRRELSSESTEVWYVYRDGRWTPD